MKIDTPTLIPVAAVVSSVLLLLAGRTRVWEIIALIASGFWLVIELGFMSWPLKNPNLNPGVVIGGTLLVCGVIVYLKTSNKREVTACVVLAVIGGVLLLHALGKLT